MAMAVRKSPLMQFFWKVHPALYRATGGLFGGKMLGMPVLLLTTTGRKSGELRTVALMYFDDGGRAVVIASYAGEPRHPDWWLNLKDEPRARVQRGREVTEVTAREAEGEERERLWKRVLGINDSYAEYQRRTERRIPVVVLEPR